MFYQSLWFWLFFVTLVALLMCQPWWIILRKFAKVPVPDKGSWGFITTDSEFLQAAVAVMAEMGDPPLCTAHSESDPNLLRYLFADGRLMNRDTNMHFLEQLGNPKAFMALVSEKPQQDAHRMCALFRNLGYYAVLLEHYAEDMKEKMFFVSFAESKYNPGWVYAFRLRGDKLGPTEAWEPVD
ncbi:hypothetical protein KW782_04595 [Candidatus Parcubacteria bacterium]|nr:hypothetical protein [Candidatus Parcubacteria bacterium]